MFQFGGHCLVPEVTTLGELIVAPVRGSESLFPSCRLIWSVLDQAFWDTQNSEANVIAV